MEKGKVSLQAFVLELQLRNDDAKRGFILDTRQIATISPELWKAIKSGVSV